MQKEEKNNLSYTKTLSLVLDQPAKHEVWPEVLLCLLTCIWLLPVKDGADAGTVSAVPVDMQAGGQ